MTRPILRKTVTLSLDADGIVGGRIKRAPTGLVAEAHLQVNESVEGFRIGSKPLLYKDLRAENPNMSRKQRDFRTSGVIIKVDETWFSGSAAGNIKTRENLAEALKALLCRDLSIAPQDIDATHTNIALLTESGPRRVTDAVVVYDSVYGGLRLTENLFADFGGYIAQLGRAAEMSGGDALVPDLITERLATWAHALSDAACDEGLPIKLPEGWYQVYKPGSVVSVFSNGNLVERELEQPELKDPFSLGVMTLYYKYNSGKTVGFIPHEQVQPTGQDWAWIMWNPTTGEYQELDDQKFND
jgi:DEAD/DEAH box helicase domain-containing protein